MQSEASYQFAPSFESVVLLALAAGGSTIVLGFFAVMAPGIFALAALAVMAGAGLLYWLKRPRTPEREREAAEAWRKRLLRNAHRSTPVAQRRFLRDVEHARQKLLVAQREPFFPHYNSLGAAILANEQVFLIALIQTLRDDAPPAIQKQVLEAIAPGARAYPGLAREQLSRVYCASPMSARRLELLLS